MKKIIILYGNSPIVINGLSNFFSARVPHQMREPLTLNSVYKGEPTVIQLVCNSMLATDHELRAAQPLEGSAIIIEHLCAEDTMAREHFLRVDEMTVTKDIVEWVNKNIEAK